MSPHTIAVVDDAPEVRTLLRTRLRLTGAFTVVAEGGSGHDAIAIAREHHPDLLLLDVSMPGMGGLDAIGPVQAASPGTRVVLYSGFSEEGLEARALELGATAFVQKSARVEEVVAALTEIAAEEPGSVPSADVVPAAPGTEDGSPAGEQILGEHVERFRAVFDQAAIGIGTLTITGQIVRANAALSRLLEVAPDAVVGVALLDVVPRADRDAIAFALTTAVQEGVAQVEHRLAGTERIVTSTVAAVRDSHERTLYLLLQSQDVTAQRSTERALVESEERFRLLVESVVDYAIFMLDPQGRIASWNRGAERLKGYTSDEILGRHFREFYSHEAQESRHPESELAAAERDGRYEEEGWRFRKDGTRFWANVVITALRDARGELVGFAKVTRDVTTQRRASQDLAHVAHELADANTELSAANARLGAAAEERAHLLAITAHELRSPIAVAGGAASTLARYWRDLEEDERAQLLGSVETSAEQMRRMLNELLLAARLDAGAVRPSPTRVRLRDHLEELAAHREVAETSGDVTIVCPPDLEAVTDPEQLGQVVTNFLTNAARYGRAPVTLSATVDDGVLHVTVEDHGPGVPDGVAGQIFDEMFLRGGSRRGTGLGLYIVRRLARGLGGDAWYERADGVTRFGVSVPAGG
ncbi:PAS domain S-box protein [Actinotalea ferrariae]|uniref:PAS domain S-box protein n=1 Tax=Actinotalea ferrariae TaxID=1386098 RepID=UPI001C8C6A8F|nr:PAS domain S-box protein [Actinotalea ferrariae]MBX9245027.1 PAS domain S-box protein [Actinotalea ferrariae]